MKKLLIALCLGFLTSIGAQAADIHVSDVWARASAGPARAGAAFMTIKNMGDADQLVSAKANVSKRVELHTHLHEDGVMKMRKAPSIEAQKGMTMLEPGGHHVMSMGLNEPFKEGDMFPLTLVFEKAGEIQVDVMVKSAGAMGNKAHSHGAGQHHKMKH